VGIHLVQRYSPGLELRYQASTTLAQEMIEGGDCVDQQTVSWEATIHQKILALEADGAAHLVQTTTPHKVSAQAEVLGVSADIQVAYCLVEPHGHLRVKSDPSLPSVCVLAPHPVDTGATWQATHELYLPFMKRPKRYEVIYALGGDEDLDEQRCVRVDFVASRQVSHVPLVGLRGVAEVAVGSTGSFWIEPVAGRIVRLQGRTLLQVAIEERVFNTLTVATQQLAASS
jgi:hypothetical protein